MLNFRTPRLLAAAVLAAVAGACSGDGPTTAVDMERAPDARSFAASHSGESGVYLCKITFMSFDLADGDPAPYVPADDPTLGVTFNFDISGADVSSASLPAADWGVLSENDCQLIYDGNAGGSITIVETSPASVMNSVFAANGFPKGTVNFLGVDWDGSTRTIALDPVPAGESWIVVKNTVTDTPLDVEKTASASYDRTYTWDLRKSVNPDAHSGAPGDVFQSIWTVTVGQSDVSENYRVTGTITVSNSNDFDVAFTLSDVLNDGTGATITCPVSNDNTGTAPANGSVDCAYTASPSDASATSNTATVTSPVGGDVDIETFSWTVNVTGDAMVDLTDPRVTYSNTISGPIVETFPEQFICPADFSVYTNGLYEFTEVNTAFLDGGSTDLEASAQVKVTCRIPDQGCTLTIGYWKTHSEFGPAPYDDNWANLPNGASTPFYLSGQTWIEVFNTAVRGNQYYNLAHQYMGAKLNTLNGASAPTEVADAIAAAEALFAAYTPAQIADLRGNDPLRAQFVALAGLLGSYNEGDIGPGHCEG